MRKIAFLLLVLFSVASNAQKPPAKFGEIPIEDMKMKVYPLDSSASAVVLFDYGVAYISYPNFYFERHVRIKVLNKDGLHQADISIPLFKVVGSGESVLNLKASTYNLDNDKIVETKLSKEGVFEDRLNKNFNFHKFTLPNVKEGSVIEYSYKIDSKFFTNFPSWQFQRSIPVIHSEYWAMIPDVFIFEKYMQGYVPLASYKVEKTRYYGMDVEANHYLAKNVPAFIPEPYMTTENDFVSKINYSLSHVNFSFAQEIMGSWEKLNENLLASEGFGKAIKGSNFLKEQAQLLTKDISDPLLKIAAISNYLKTNFEWDGTSDYIADPLKKVFERKKGSAGDLNILLASMLDKIDINVEMILLSTRDHGFIRKSSPMPRQLNYVVCSVKVGDKELLFDVTEKFLPYDVLPSRCLNGEGLKISKFNFGWVEIGSKAKEKTTVITELNLNESGVLAGKIDFTYDGYDALKMRKDFFSKGQEVYAKQIMTSQQWSIEKSDFKNVNEFEKPAKMSCEVSIDEHATKSGDVIYLNPFISSRIEENPFKSESRVYPIDYGNKVDKTYISKITIPDGFVIDDLPKSRVFVLPENAAKYSYNVVQFNNTINITSNFQVNKIVFAQTDYPLLREFYNQVVAKQEEQIVIKKK